MIILFWILKSCHNCVFCIYKACINAYRASTIESDYVENKKPVHKRHRTHKVAWFVPQSYQILFSSARKKVHEGIVRGGRVLRGTDYKLLRELESLDIEICQQARTSWQTCWISNFNAKKDLLFLSFSKFNFSKLRTFSEKTWGINKTKDMIILQTIIRHCSSLISISD